MVISTRRDNEFGFLSHNFLNGGRQGCRHRHILANHDRMHFEQVPDFIFKAGALCLHTLHQRLNFGLYLHRVLFDQIAPVDGDHTAVRHQGRRIACIPLFGFGKPAMD